MISGEALLLMAIIWVAVAVFALGVAELIWCYVYPRSAEYRAMRAAAGGVEHIDLIGLTAPIATRPRLDPSRDSGTLRSLPRVRPH